MFEQLGQPKSVPKVSIAMSLGILAAYLVGSFGGLCLFIALEDRRFGMQIATAITYTYFAFWYIFFPTRGMLEKYSLRSKTVQRRIPRLLAIHCALLALIFQGQTMWLAAKSRMQLHDTLYALVLIVSVTIIFFAQVLISRRILGRGEKEPFDA
jgi:hypothetical protein